VVTQFEEVRHATRAEKSQLTRGIKGHKLIAVSGWFTPAHFTAMGNF
jgi:hypothetical protein